MSYKLFLDDERFPVSDEYVIARSTDEAISIVQARGFPDEIAFDHDLGGDDTAIKFIWWAIDSFIDDKITISQNFTYTVHSQNPIGAENIRHLMDGFLNSEVFNKEK